MKPLEIENALKNMTVIVDSREQDTEQAKKRYCLFGVPWERGKLNFGDYTAKFELSDGSVFNLSNICVIERKMSIDELCVCYTHDRTRFEKEFERAKKSEAKIYLLIENANWEMIYNERYRSKMTSRALVASILAWLSRYNCQVIMCKAETSGKLIHDILYREGKERLTNIA